MTFMRYSSLIVFMLMTYVMEEAFGLTASQVTVTDKRGDFITAVSHCKSLGMKLIRVHNEDENNLVHSLTVKVGRFWIDGSDNQKEGSFVNWDIQPLTYTKWHGGEPNNLGGNENCVEGRFYEDKTWNDIDCKTNNGIVCYTKGLTASEITVTDKKGDFATAVSHCKSLGQKLIRVNNEDENILVNGLTAKVGRFWIDGSDNKKEGSFVNSYNQPLTYTKWHGGEPNNLGGNENCVEGRFFEDQTWNDIDCKTNNGIVCYTQGLTASQITVTDKRGDFSTALSHCKSLGQKLIRLEDEEENILIHSLTVKVGRFWIDGSDNKKEGSFVNSDSQPLTYTKWHGGEPNNLGGNENCVEGRFFEDQTWNDIDCKTNNGIVCYKHCN